jgi:hypothetical protein
MLVADGTTPAISELNGWAVGTDNVDIDVAQESIDVFRLLAPSENDNYPPPDDAKFIVNHRSRLFAVTDNELYWSEAGFPEAFNIVNDNIPIGSEDGEPITGFAVLGDALVIFKKQSTYALIGEDPRSWSVEPIDATIGCVSYPSIASFDNKLFWMSLRGPQMWSSVNNQIADITTEIIGPNFEESAVDTDELSNSVAVGNPTQFYVGWAVAPKNRDRNEIIIPFHYKMQRWMSHRWDVVDVRSCTVVNDSRGRGWPMISDYDGNVYQLGVTHNDGVPSGTPAQGVVTSATSLTLTDSTATWTVDALKGRYVWVWDEDEGVRTAQRKRIVSNTATTLTVYTSWTQLPSVDWLYSLGGILLDWRSGFRHGGVPFFKKRIEFQFLELTATSLGVSCDLEVFKNLDEYNPIISRTLTLGAGDLWDVGLSYSNSQRWIYVANAVDSHGQWAAIVYLPHGCPVADKDKEDW